jgi:hypothetical protein
MENLLGWFLITVENVRQFALVEPLTIHCSLKNQPFARFINAFA